MHRSEDVMYKSSYTTQLFATENDTFSDQKNEQ